MTYFYLKGLCWENILSIIFLKRKNAQKLHVNSMYFSPSVHSINFSSLFFPCFVVYENVVPQYFLSGKNTGKDLGTGDICSPISCLCYSFTVLLVFLWFLFLITLNFLPKTLFSSLFTWTHYLCNYYSLPNIRESVAGLVFCINGVTLESPT